MPKVLIVEDDVQLAQMYKLKLEHDGFTVEVANEGRTGFQKAVEVKPDIILLDMMLIDREYSGIKMLEELRQTEIGKTIPVIALTNLTKKEVTEKAQQLGVFKYLIKAMNTPEEVVQQIKECLSTTPVSETNSQPQPQE